MTDNPLYGLAEGYQITTMWPTLSDSVGWPREAVGGALDLFYGNPRGEGNNANPSWEEANLTTIVCPWQFKEGGHNIRIHKKCAASLSRILDAVWNSSWINKDQAKISQYHLDEWGGSYNFRVNVNAPSKLSLHAYGAAFDMAPDRNPNGKSWVDGESMLPRFFIDAMLSEGWCWGGDFSSTKDAMHFQATFNTHKDAVPLQPAIMPSDPVPQQPIPVPQVAASVDVHLQRMRQFLLSETGIDKEVEAFKTSILTDLDALKSKISSYSVTVATQPQQQPASLPIAVKVQPPPLVISKPTVVVSQQQSTTVQVFKGITATMFGGSGDPNTSAYDNHVITDTELGCALPARFSVVRPQVNVVGPRGSCVVDIVDVGPWNISDPYWTTGSRPQAESGTDMKGRHTNGAGIDLTPAAAKLVGIDGKGLVDWNFVTAPAVVGAQPGGKTMASTPSQVTVPVQSALASKINWTSVVQLAATLVTVFSGGKMNLSADQQVMIVGLIGTLAPIATIAFRTFGTASVTPQSLPSS